MNEKDFVQWLRGFAEGVHHYNMTPKQWDHLKELLETVGTTDSFVLLNQTNRYGLDAGNKVVDEQNTFGGSFRKGETVTGSSSNNTAVILRHKVDKEYFLKLWDRIKKSGSGEPGIYLSNDKDWGTNPCCEIALRPYQFCNLTEVVIREKDQFEDLKRKLMLAPILGTAQSNLTKFPYVRKLEKNNPEEERLLGSSLTRKMDNELTRGKNQ